ncbi:MAG TPA: UDP-3-O-(3-hydroxymyristoyl)glucosamine N-acyltransferase [Flavobacteriales bacterium]|nr:UDP-3-O-(3-hydroxymyristoyl)glucosamine N-acyltransferase [Flavobacteriales bacterium]
MGTVASDIIKESGEECYLIALEGNKQAIVEGMASFESGGPGDLVVLPNREALNKMNGRTFAAVVIPKELEKEAPRFPDKTAVFVSTAVELSHALLKQKLFTHDYSKVGWKKVHASAVIHNSVKIPASTTVGPGAVIEKGVVIGKNCRIMANSVIEHNAVIGSNVQIHPGVIIGWDCEIGDECSILSNSVIGGDGFGFSQDQHFNHHRIPQTGNVVIGKKVTVGAVNTIDRGTYGSTIVGEGCIMGSLCHIGHNVTLGKNCIMTGGFLCGGSCTLGDRVVASGGAMLKDHLNICSDVYLLHRAGVVHDITKPGVYAGSPVLPMPKYVKSNAIYAQLDEMRQKLRELTGQKSLSSNLSGSSGSQY